MKTLLSAIAIFIVTTCLTYSQSADVESHIRKGIELHDAGDYRGAIEQYKTALDMDATSSLAHYELVLSYFALKEYDKVIEHSDTLIAQNSAPYTERAYTMKASALDMLNQPREAIELYKKAIKLYSGDNMLYYNMAITYYNLREYTEAEEALQKAIELNPRHSSSHLLLSTIEAQQQSKVKSILAVCHFLLLEPRGNRAKAACGLLNEQLDNGIQKIDEHNTSISITANEKEDEFNAAELMIAMLGASKSLEDNKDKKAAEIFAENLTSLFSLMSELKKDNTGFWWDNYINFYSAMVEQHQVETFSYLITQSGGDEEVNTWLADNKEKVDSFRTWYSQYQKK